MDEFGSSNWSGGETGSVPAASNVSGPRLTPSSAYGTLGPDSDFARLNRTDASSYSTSLANLRRGFRKPVFLVQCVGVFLGIAVVLIARTGNRFDQRQRTGSGLLNRQSHSVVADKPQSSLDRQQAQAQAETLLTRAVTHTPGAAAEISTRVDSWRGNLTLTPQLTQLTTVALNSDDRSVRSSAVEIQLAAYGLEKNDDTIEQQLLQAGSSDHSRKIWALWTLGLLGNRGLQSERIVRELTTHLIGPLADSDEDSRHWAVEALALVATDSSVWPLLRAMHDDSSALVRERAACSLAESGMLNREQRLAAVPRLIAYSDDPQLDAQTHTWAFQALTDITHEHLPDDSAAWRSWYQGRSASAH